MSGTSEAAAMVNRDLFGVSPVAANSLAPAVNPEASQTQMEQQMHMPYASDDGFRQMAPSHPPYQSITGGATVIHQGPHMNSGEQRRKRGRPRRYGPEGGMNVPTALIPQQQPQTFSPPATQAEVLPGGSASPTAKKARGRPRGSHNKKQQKEASGSGSIGTGFIPHIVTVNAGEDISSKILSVSQNGPRAICILSANGSISHVTLQQAATSGGTATYEGRFDILSLSGSFMLHEVAAGQRSRTGGISVSLAGPDGRVLGGSVAGLLIAASPSQVVVGCFEPEAHKEPGRNHTDTSFQQNVNHVGAVGHSSSPSRGTQSESSGGPASPLNLSSGACIDFPEGLSWINNK